MPATTSAATGVGSEMAAPYMEMAGPYNQWMGVAPVEQGNSYSRKHRAGQTPDTYILLTAVWGVWEWYVEGHSFCWGVSVSFVEMRR